MVKFELNFDNFLMDFELNAKSSEIPIETLTVDYRFEYGGLLVYDIKGQLLANNEKPPQPSPIKNIHTKSQVKSHHKDWKTSENFPSVPAYPCNFYYKVPNDHTTLTFNSKFESANLSKAIKMSDYEYNLHLQSDIGTHTKNHWFYFSVVNPRETSITFNIVNLSKKDFLFQAGMKPAIFSKGEFERTGNKWQRGGTNIFFTSNGKKRDGIETYTLKFTYSFLYKADLVYFAYAIPYSYTDLEGDLNRITEQFSDIARCETLCKSLAGNNCYIVTITSSISDYFSHSFETKLWELPSNTRKKLSQNLWSNHKIKKLLLNYSEKKHQEKFAVVLMSRVHSGETVGSYMLKGALDFLLSDSAKSLRKNCVFKILPMLNPDGVRYGNYRTSLLGVDLNRRWHRPDKTLHPTIFYAKKMIASLKDFHSIKLVCDLHGHTKKLNVFMYGCCKTPMDLEDSKNNLLAKTFPYHMRKVNKNFSLKDSHFRIESDKETTARVVIFNEFQVPHCYTMEASFFGRMRQNKYVQFSENDLENIGKDLCSLCGHFSSSQKYSKLVIEANDYYRSLVFGKGKELKSIEGKESDDEEINGFYKKSIETYEDFGEDFLENIEIAEILPDENSSGSDSEISEVEVQVTKTQPAKIAISQTKIPMNPPVPNLRIQKNKKRASTIIQKPENPRETLKVLTLHCFDFPIFQSFTTKQNPNIFKSKLKNKTNIRNRSSQPIQFFSGLPRLSSNNISLIFSEKKKKSSILCTGNTERISKFIKESPHFNHSHNKSG